MKELIHFAHGNGFPSPCYMEVLTNLQPKFDYCYIDRIGHNPLYPVTENWDYLVDEVINSIETQADQPVVGLGHSLGGVLSLMASIKKPELFKAVIMLDSPVFGIVKTYMLRMVKAIGLIDNITPAYRTKNRKQNWSNREELIVYLKSRPLFKTFSEQCLVDYIEYGLTHDDRGYHLRFDREVEYSIYRTIPHNLPTLKEKLQVSTAVIYGDKTQVVKASDRKYMNNKFGILGFEIEGTHLFPFENPQSTARLVTEVIKNFGI